MVEERCEFCRYCVATPENQEGDANCHFNPPTLMLGQMNQFQNGLLSVRPAVKLTDRACGGFDVK